MKVRIPIGPGRYQLAGLVITDVAIYLAQTGKDVLLGWSHVHLELSVHADGTEEEFSRIVGVTYSQINQMIVGQSWQLLELVYSDKAAPRRPLKQVIVTGNEAVSRYGNGST